MEINIRPVGDGDLAKTAPLCGELGYPATSDELVPRLANLKHNDDNLLLLAESAGGDALGLIHAEYRRMFIETPQVIVLSLVVAELARGRNVGARLLTEAEAWARYKGVDTVLVGSNVVRERAHRFYHAHGYSEVKRWSVLRKKI